MSEIDNVAYFRKWAADSREASGPSVDADQIEAAANELATLRERLSLLTTPFETISRLEREMGERCPRKRGDDCVYPECDCDRPV